MSKENSPVDPKEKPSGRAIVLEWTKDIVIAAAIALVIVQFIKPTIVKEYSMEPNFHENDYLFIYKLAYKFNAEPEKGDVIVFRSDLLTETGKKKLLIKRVIGTPGDVITIKDGEVYINGKKDDQSYTKDGVTNGTILNLKVPEGKLFCMGDNRLNSQDSRMDTVGLVDEDRVVGKVVFRVYPFSKFGIIKNPYE